MPNIFPIVFRHFAYFLTKLNMKQMRLRLSMLACMLTLTVGYAHAQTSAPTERNCWTNEYLEGNLEAHPQFEGVMEEIENHTQHFIENAYTPGEKSGVITIPTVVHVIYSNATQNISEAQINSQLAVMNADFRRTNADASNTPSMFAGVAADTEIEFCLASVDPNGNPTTGITRTPTSVSAFGTGSGCTPSGQPMKFSSSGGKDAWPADQYLNMWVCNLGGGTLGYAQFPGSGCAATDGVVMGYTYFGTIGTAQSPFDGGRTTTHEIGHWLNLRHIWGDGPCSQDDYVSDTPTSDAANYGCSIGHVSCGSTDMVQNYMDYSDDGCMNLFTQGQKARMRAVLEPGGYRSSLVNSQGCSGGTTPTTCDVPTGINNSSTADDALGFSWTTVSGASSYNVRARQVGTSSWSTGTVSGTTLNYTGLTSCTEYEVQIEAVCSSSLSSGYSSSVIATTSGCGTTGYCAASGNTVADEWIQTVAVAAINNDSGANNGYGDFTAQSTDLEQGSTVSCTLTPGYAGSAYDEYWRIWIDYNADLDFDDAGELVYDAGSGSNAAVNASFNVPNNAPTGTTRMRVAMKWVGSLNNGTSDTAAPGTCGTFAYGEVEDYTVNIVAPAPPATCDLPTNLSADAQTNEVAISWDLVTGASGYNVQVRTTGGTWQDFTSTSSPLNLSGLTACTDYEYRIEADCSAAGITSGYTSVSTFSSTGCTTGGNDYCAASGNAVTDEWIANVTVADINNSTGADGGYGDYTSLSTDLEQNAAISVNLTPAFAGTAYEEHWRVWIDYNQDADFNDAGELVYDSGSGSTSAVSGNFTVPNSATLGNTRMRVAMKWVGTLSNGNDETAPPTSCDTFAYGEVEDYTVNIVAAATTVGYCDAGGGDNTYEWIAGVELNTINNTSGADAAGYGDYTAQSTDLEQGGDYTGTLTPAFQADPYTEHWRIWIDYNQDGDFDDAGELAFDADSATDQVVSADISVPSTAILGETRMRIAMKWIDAQDADLPNACGSFAYGEVEDYTVNIVAGGPTVCDVPAGLNASAGSDNATLSWVSASGADSYSIRYKPASSNAWITVTAATTTYDLTGLVNCGDYEFQVQSVCDGVASSYSSSYNFSTTGCIATYCEASGLPLPYEYIANVTLADINNASANDSGYGDYTAVGTELAQEGTYSISLTPGFSGNTYDQSFTVYIDWNGDYDFGDANELVYQSPSASDATVTGDIVVPADAQLGETRMRVMMKAGNNATQSCEMYNTGEVEDYTITVVDGAVAPPPLNYCDAGGNDASYEWIAEVGFNTIGHASGTNGGYADFTNISTTVEQGSTHNIILIPGFSGQTYDERWRVWIDYNQDGTFDNATELAFDPGAVSQSTVNGIITIPSSANLGETRMRVSMKYIANGAYAPNSCSNFEYGEVEDYTVIIEAGTSTPPPANYCDAPAANTQYEWIESVEFADINNASGNDGGYGNYAFVSTDLAAGTSETITLTPGFSGDAYNEFWSVWIDYNRDGDFSDSGELAYSSSASTGVVTGAINVPTNALNGETRMRIIMKYNAAANNPCATNIGDGEIEDYIVNIVGGAKFEELVPATNNVFAVQMYPNPAQSLVHIACETNEAQVLTTTIYDLTGRIIRTNTATIGAGTTTNTIDVSDLQSGYYMVHVAGNEHSETLRLTVMQK